MAEFTLETDRLILRPIRRGDAELQHQLWNTPAVMARLGGVMSLAEIEARHRKTMELRANEGIGFMFMIEKGSGEAVGQCGLKRVDSPHAKNLGDLEIGWTVREDRWRRGYAREAASAVLNWAFGPLAAPLVVALSSLSNSASWGLMERLGMMRRPELDFADPDYPAEDNPTIVYAITAEQWSAR